MREAAKRRGVMVGAMAAMAGAVAWSAAAWAGDWPMWGRTPQRNMVSDATGIPQAWDAGRLDRTTERIDPDSTRHVKWIAKLGSQSYGNVTVADGRVFVGTNNAVPRDPTYRGDRSNLMAFDEASGEFLWQLSVPKLGAGKVSDWEYLGICSSPAVDGDRLYIVTNLGEVVCLDVDGMADGNDGPFTDELSYLSRGEAVDDEAEPGEMVGDIIWRFDLREQLGVFPHNVTSNSPLVVGDRVYVGTSNGVDWSHTNVPSPRAPAFIGLDKNTGELVGEEGEGICRQGRLLHSNWSSPAYAEPGGEPTVIFAAGDGWCYGFSPETVTDEDGFDVFKLLWKFDGNPKRYRFDEQGNPRRYATYEGPSEFIATPVVYRDRVYVGIGQDPEHGEGVGRLSCYDITKRGDITESGRVWVYDDLHRTISTVAIADGLVYAADYTGRLHCLDAETGEAYWVHDTRSHIWGSPLAVDGKVYIGNEDGFVVVLRQGKELEVIDEVAMPSAVYGTPIVANGVLYVQCQTHLYAIAREAN